MTLIPQRARTALMASAAILVPTAAWAQESGDAQEDEYGDLEEVVVQGVFIPDEKRATSEIANVLDAAEIAQAGDSDIAVALQRVTGLSVVDGRFVFVRGLGGRYSSIELNGANLPGSDPLRRVTELDLFPTSLTESVLVQKTFSPEYPAQFAGGLIDIRTKSVPDESFFEVSFSGEFNTVSTEDGLSYDSPDIDFLGFAGSGRNIPDEILIDPSLASLSPQQLEAAGEALGTRGFSADEEPNLPGIGFSATGGSSWDAGEGRIGFIAAVSYNLDYTNKNGIRRSLVSTANGLVPNEDFSPTAQSCIEEAENAGVECGLRSTEQDVLLSGFLSAGWEINPDNVLKITSTVLRKSTKESTIQTGDQSADPGTLAVNTRNDFIERQVWSNQVGGEHIFNIFSPDSAFLATQVNWNFTYTRTDRDAPLRRETLYIFDDFDGVFRLNTRPDANTTTFGALDDDQFEVGVDIVQPATLFGTPIDFKFGGNYFDKDRSSGFRRYSFDFPPGALLDLRQQVPEIIFGPANVGPGQFVLTDFTDPSDFFDAALETYAAYGGIDWELTPGLRLALGMHYEESEQNSQTFDRISGRAFDVTQESDYWLPSATVTWEFAENFQVRGAYSQTINRPDLLELTTTFFLDNEIDRVRRGNPGLQIAEVENFDVRFEWYFGLGEQMSIGAFYKEISDPIEQTFGQIGNDTFITFLNAEDAELTGIEFEIEKDLSFQDWFGWEWLGQREFYVRANGAYIDSEVNIDLSNTGGFSLIGTDPNESISITIDGDSEVNPSLLFLSSAAGQLITNTDRRLQGQSEYLANITFGYENFDSGEEAALIFNYTGDRIFLVGINEAPDIFEEPPITLNFVFRKTFELGTAPLEVSFKATNLLDDDFRLVQGGEIFQTYSLGQSFSLGMRYRF